MLYGDNGILNKAKFASEEYKNATEEEKEQLAKVDDYIESSRGEKTFTETELLKEKIIVQTSTTVQYINLDVELKESIENYRYILIIYGSYDNNTQKISGKTSLLLPTSEALNAANLYLNSASGLNYSTVDAIFKDNKTIRIVDTLSSNTGRKYFAVSSIKGIN